MKFQIKINLLQMGLLFLLPTCPLLAKTVPPTATEINYGGRFDFSDPQRPIFNWSGTYIEAGFTGTSIGIHLNDGNNYYEVEIDGKLLKPVITQSGTRQYKLSTNLEDGDHLLRFSRRNENHYAKSEFLGLEIDETANLTPLPAVAAPLIEFIGDSYTVGYGNESSTRECNSAALNSTTNTNLAFGPLTAKALKADYTILGWSGQGMVRNYGDGSPLSDTPYPVYYDNILGINKSPWNYSTRIPNLVVICLGTNDFSTQPHPSEKNYTSAYIDFITRVKSNYPDAKILCLSTPVGPHKTYLQKVVAQSDLKFPGDIYFVEFPIKGLTYTGCAGHPNLADDRMIADVLVGAIQKIENWNPRTVTFTPGKVRGDIQTPIRLNSEKGIPTPLFPVKKNDEWRYYDSEGKLKGIAP